MSDKYVVQRLESWQFSDEFPFAEESILKAGYRFWPEPEQGCFKIEKPGHNACAMCYSRHFNSVITAFLRSVREMDLRSVRERDSDTDIREVVNNVQCGEKIFPNQQDMELEGVVSRMAEEYLYVGTKNRGVITPILKGVDDDSYVEWGLLHILQRHYEDISGFGIEKGTPFPEGSTINEILGAVVRAVLEGTEKKSSDDRLRLTVPAEMGPAPTEGVEPHLLVLEPTDHTETFTTVTFFPNTR